MRVRSRPAVNAEIQLSCPIEDMHGVAARPPAYIAKRVRAWKTEMDEHRRR